VFLALALVLFGIGGAAAADLTVREVTEALMRADPLHPADFSHRDLSRLDLSGLDFTGANLEGADLYGADLTEAKFTGSRLIGARLDLAVVIRTSFAGADLSRARLVRLAASSTLEPRPDEAPSFAGANLSGATIFARLARADMHGARLEAAILGGDERTPHTMNLTRADLAGCNLANADLAGANLAGASLRFANLAGANLARADLRRSDLSQADLSRANLAGAALAGADLDEARLAGAVGLDSTIGLAEARNLGRARR
jgi:uncharacterized protein YjbI with pentapeptide repeats